MVLKVGPKKIRFDVHKHQLCKASPVFEAAFNGKFREKGGIMNLVDGDVHAFEHFVQWVYKDDVEIPLEGEIEDITAQTRELINVYILADKYDVSLLKDHIVELLFDAVRPWADEAARRRRIALRTHIEHAYANTARSSKLRALLTACYTWHVDFHWFTEGPGLNWLYRNPEIATDLAINFASRLESGKKANPFAKDKDASPFLELRKSVGRSDEI